MILLKLYYNNGVIGNTQSEKKDQSVEISMDETPDEMETRAQEKFKSITEEYPRIDDPSFYKIESFGFNHDMCFKENQEEAQEYIKAKMLYQEASIIRMLGKTDLTLEAFNSALMYNIISPSVSMISYLLRKEYEKYSIDVSYDRIFAYLQGPFVFQSFRLKNTPPNTSHLENLPASRLQSSGKILETHFAKLFKILFLAADVFPKEYPIDDLMALQSKIQQFIQKTFKLD